MKTLTEFNGIVIKTAAQKRTELLAGGKTVEELPAAMGEALKVEGDRLNFLLAALEAVDQKLQDLKRVVVFAPAEGEKVSSAAVEKNGQHYLAEYYPSLEPKKGKERKPRGGKGDGKRGRKKRGGRRGRGDERGARGPRPNRDAKGSGGPTPKPGPA